MNYETAVVDYAEARWQARQVVAARKRAAGTEYDACRRERRVLDDPPPSRLHPRGPDDPPYRCAWCCEWRCVAVMRLCADCEAEYRAMAVGMTEYGAPEEATGDADESYP